MKNRSKGRKPRDCTGCPNCTYLGEGDFVCDKLIHKFDKAFVICAWTPTENFLHCRKGGRR